MYKVSKKNEIYGEEEIKQIAEVAEKASKEELINIIYRLSELESKMKWSSQKTIIFETEIIKLCMKEDTKGLEERIEKLEKEIKEGVKVQSTPQVQTPRYETPTINTTYTYAPPIKPKTKKEAEPKQTAKEFTPSQELANGNIISDWQNVLNDFKKQGKVMLYANLIGTEAVELNDMTVSIRFNNGLNSFRKELLGQPENMNALTKEISVVCGKPMQIKFEDASGTKTKTQQVKQKIKQEEHFEPNISQAEQVTKQSGEDMLEGLDIPINFVEE